jgi:UDP-glucose 4-epimerase
VQDSPRREGDPPSLIASNAAAARDLGWVPRRGIEQMAADAWTFAQRVRIAK